jgi:hypothetical protein
MPMPPSANGAPFHLSGKMVDEAVRRAIGRVVTKRGQRAEPGSDAVPVG